MNALHPDPDHARALDRRMRERLVASLRHIVERAGSHLDASGFEPAAARLLARAVDPLVFGAYYELVLALEADDLDTARQRFGEIVSATAWSGETRVLTLPDPTLDAGAARYVRLLDTDPDVPFGVTAPAPAQAQAAMERVTAALAMLDRAHPALAAELRALLRVIVLAAPADTMRGSTFDGASSFMLWGAVVLNSQAHPAALDMLQALVHESGHNVLFGLCADGPLVENDDAERYTSPLRTDPRPMDGIFHATYVCARVHAALRIVLDSGVLRGEEADQARADLALHAKGYRDGAQIVARHARLTTLGRVVLADTAKVMQHAG
jgi:HEXXH motif-containing protein